MPGNREPLGGRQVGDPLGGVRDGLRGVAIRADLERVLALDLEQVADLGEHARDGEVIEAHRRWSGRLRRVDPRVDAQALGLDA